MPNSLVFPPDFLWGTSTAAAQVETASDHIWRGERARDGYVFERTTDHELRRIEDATYICRFGTVYRCGIDWARLQPAAGVDLVPEVVAEYRAFFALLRERRMQIMLVIHHFAHPTWLEAAGGWAREEAIGHYVNFAQQCIAAFGDQVSYWNTFNEPNVFALNGYVLGGFPPHRKNIRTASRVLRHLGRAHRVVYDLIKEQYAHHPVGISLNTCWFEGLTTLGKPLAAFTDWWFHTFAARQFERVDFWGLSYYAYVPFAPMAVTQLDTPNKIKQLGLPHDRMWAYRPEGLARNLRRFWRQYRKPLWVTENGICTDDDHRRIAAIQDYLRVCHTVIEEGIPLLGYIHWSTWDNFEWNLGPTYRFGLVRVNLDTMERRMTAAGEYYAQVTQNNAVEVP